MTPHRHLSRGTARKPSVQREIEDTFIGLAFQLHPEPESSNPDVKRDLEYALVVHDGTGVVEGETFKTQIRTKGLDSDQLTEEVREMSKEVLGKVKAYETDRGLKVCMVAMALPFPEDLKGQKGVEAFATIWLHLDAIPFVTTPATAIFDRLPMPSPEASAGSAISAGLKHLHPATHTATKADVDPENHSVLVDAGGQIKLCSLTQYRQSSSDALWNRFIKLADHLREKKTTIHFFSATPQGGGVALMRHALIRLWRLVGVEVKWFVPEGHPAIFDITKRKMHNVLQGVADEGVELSDEDKRNFEIWTEQNFEHFWSKGAIDADLIVIDDPQLTPLIPIIKKHRPDSKLIFRSHIQIQSNLTDDPSTPQARTWDYLFSFIKDVDLFLAHPVRFFVPRTVKEKLPVLYMAPSTDPLDGLNKPFGHSAVTYYRQYFTSLAKKQCGIEIEWDRGYICQVARFDPSKGYDQLLEAYRRFRVELQKEGTDKGPQLILMGHASVDDPDGAMIVEKLGDMLNMSDFEWIRNDVAIVRAPPSDALLGCIMQGAWVATQLSTREGFEVKVTEIINKRVPIIVYDAGGIPLQVNNECNGWIVPTDDIDSVAKLLVQIHTGEAKIARPTDEDHSQNGKTDPNTVSDEWVKRYDEPVLKIAGDAGATSEDFWTVGNATKWMHLATQVLGIPLDGVGRAFDQSKAGEGENVWKLVMDDETKDGEAEVR